MVVGGGDGKVGWTSAWIACVTPDTWALVTIVQVSLKLCGGCRGWEDRVIVIE